MAFTPFTKDELQKLTNAPERLESKLASDLPEISETEAKQLAPLIKSSKELAKELSQVAPESVDAAGQVHFAKNSEGQAKEAKFNHLAKCVEEHTNPKVFNEIISGGSLVDQINLLKDETIDGAEARRTLLTSIFSDETQKVAKLGGAESVYANMVNSLEEAKDKLVDNAQELNDVAKDILGCYR